jgi:hypothetical protein
LEYPEAHDGTSPGCCPPPGPPPTPPEEEPCPDYDINAIWLTCGYKCVYPARPGAEEVLIVSAPRKTFTLCEKSCPSTSPVNQVPIKCADQADQALTQQMCAADALYLDVTYASCVTTSRKMCGCPTTTTTTSSTTTTTTKEPCPVHEEESDEEYEERCTCTTTTTTTTATTVTTLVGKPTTTTTATMKTTTTTQPCPFACVESSKCASGQIAIFTGCPAGKRCCKTECQYECTFASGCAPDNVQQGECNSPLVCCDCKKPNMPCTSHQECCSGLCVESTGRCWVYQFGAPS